MPRRSYFSPVQRGSTLSGVAQGIQQGVSNLDAGLRQRRAEELALDERDYRRNRDTIMDERYEDELDYRDTRDAIADARYEEGVDRSLRAEGWRPGAVPTVRGDSSFDGMDFMVPDPNYETMAGPLGGYSRMRPEARFSSIAQQMIDADPRFAGMDPVALGEGLMADIDPEQLLPWHQRAAELGARRRAGERVGLQRDSLRMSTALGAAVDQFRNDLETQGIQMNAAIEAALEGLKSNLEVSRYEDYARIFGIGGGAAAPPPGPDGGGEEEAARINEILQAFTAVGGDETRFIQLLQDSGLSEEDIALTLELVRNAPTP